MLSIHTKSSSLKNNRILRNFEGNAPWKGCFTPGTKEVAKEYKFLP